MKGITKNLLCMYLEEVGIDVRETECGNFYAYKYADESFAHNIKITYYLHDHWLHIVGVAEEFGPSVDNEYKVLELLNQMNMQRATPVAYYLNCQPHFRYSLHLVEEVSEAYIKRDGLRYGTYSIVKSFTQLGEMLATKGISTVSPF